MIILKYEWKCEHSCVLISLVYFWTVKLLFLPLTNLLFVYANYKMCGSVKKSLEQDLKQEVVIKIIENLIHLVLDVLRGLHSAWASPSGNVCFSCPPFLQTCFQRKFQVFA